MKTELSEVTQNHYGDRVPDITDVFFIEIKTYSKRKGRYTYATYYGPELYRKINTETMTNPSAYIQALKEQGWKRLHAKKVFIGHKQKEEEKKPECNIKRSIFEKILDSINWSKYD